MMLVTMLPTSLAVDSEPTIKVGTATADISAISGTEVVSVEIPVTIENNPGFAGMDLTFSVPENWSITAINGTIRESDSAYTIFCKETQMTIPGLGTVTVPQAFVSPTTNPEKGKLAAAYDGNAGISEDGLIHSDGVICWLTCAVPAGEINDDYEIKVEIEKINTTETAINTKDQYTVANGKVTVTGGVNLNDIKPYFTTEPKSATYTYPETIAAPLTVAASVQTEGTLSYQWYKDETAIGGANNASYTPELSEFGSASYTCKVTNTYNGRAFSATSEPAVITYNKATIGQLTLTPATAVYTGSPITVTPSIAGLTGDDYTISGMTSATNVGEYTVTATGTGNYKGISKATWEITPAEIVTSGTKTMTIYTNGQKNTIGSDVLSATVKGTGNNLQIAYQITEGSDYVTRNDDNTITAKAVGTAKIKATITADNHSSKEEMITVTVQNKIVADDNITFTDKKTSETYTGTAHALSKFVNAASYNNAETGITYSLSGTEADGTVVAVKNNVALATETITNAGTYTITAHYEDDTHAGSKSITVTINPKALTVTPTAVNRAYNGTCDVTVNLALNGAVAGDAVSLSQSSVTGTVATAAAETGKAVTLPALTLTGADAGNYTLTQPTGVTVNINKAEITASATAADKVYNGTTAAAVTVTFTGLVSGETLALDTDYTVSGAAFDNKNVGSGKTVTCAVALKDSTVANNYVLTSGGVTATAAITPADYTVAVPNASAKVGSANLLSLLPKAAVTPAVAGETISGTLSWYSDAERTTALTDDAVADLAVGATKTVYWSYAQSGNANFTAAAKTGSITITIVEGDPQTITFANAAVSKIYGDAKFTETATLTKGEGDVTYSSNNTAVATVNPTTGEVTIVGVGTATITATAARVPGKWAEASTSYTLTVARKPVTVTADDKSMTYGGTVPALTFTHTASDLVGTDTVDALGVTLTTTASGTSNVGTYDITGTSDSEKYDVTVTKGTLTINKANHDNVTAAATVFSSKVVTGAQTKSVDLSAQIAGIAGAAYGTPAKGEGSMITDASMSGKQLTITYTPSAAGTKQTVTIPVTADNYNDFAVVVTVTAIDKNDVSAQITFADKTVIWNGAAQSLDAATYGGSSANITYKVGDGAFGAMPSFTDAGTYTVTARYEDAQNLGYATATLTITNKLDLSVKATTTTDEELLKILVNNGLYTVTGVTNATGKNETTAAVKGTKKLTAYLSTDPGQQDAAHQWIGLLIGTTLNGSAAPADSLYYSADGVTFSKLDEIEFTDAVVHGGTGNEFVLWMKTDVDKTLTRYIATLADGSDAVKLTITFTPYKSSSGSSSSSISYSISIADKTPDGGKISVSPKSAKKGDTVTITVTPDEGYVLDELIVTDKNDNELKLKDKGNGKFTFTMPASKVEIEATFKEEAPAITTNNTIVLTIGSPVATVYGQTVVNDVAPIARNNRTLLPIRFIAEALGAQVEWNADLQKVTIRRADLLIELYLGQTTAYVNGQPVVLDVAAFAENNRTYLPLRFIAENLGATVLWDQPTQSVTIIG